MRRFTYLLLLFLLITSWPAHAQNIDGQAGGASLTVKDAAYEYGAGDPAGTRVAR